MRSPNLDSTGTELARSQDGKLRGLTGLPPRQRVLPLPRRIIECLGHQLKASLGLGSSRNPHPPGKRTPLDTTATSTGKQRSHIRGYADRYFRRTEDRLPEHLFKPETAGLHNALWRDLPVRCDEGCTTNIVAHSIK